MASKLTSKTFLSGANLVSPVAVNRPVQRSSVVVKAQQCSRRESLTGLVAGVTTWLAAGDAWAAFGEAANILGKTTDTSGYIPYSGPGFAVKIPSKWNPSRERDFEGVEVRYEDNGDSVTNFIVIVRKTDKSSIGGYGSQTDFLNSVVSPLLGQQVFTGETLSEGGFDPNKVSTASLLDADTKTDKNGKQYYTYSILTRSADGDEGGRHQLVAAAVSNGNLYILKAQCGDKRWFKGASKDVLTLLDSFTVA